MNHQLLALSPESFRNEKLYITANKNGYDNKMIEFMMKK